jgi:DNA-binding transcriptional LysR family regulator
MPPSADPSAGELRVGFTEVPGAGLVPAAIDRLYRRYPRMTVRTEHGSFSTILGFLRDRKCEVAVVWMLSPEPDMLFRPLHYEQLFIVVGSAANGRGDAASPSLTWRTNPGFSHCRRRRLAVPRWKHFVRSACGDHALLW